MSAFDHDNILKLLGIVSERKNSFKMLKEVYVQGVEGRCLE